MSVGYWSTEIFLPPCATCDHDVYSHLRHETGIPRRRCTQHTPAPCGCKRYELGNPKDWTPLEVQERIPDAVDD